MRKFLDKASHDSMYSRSVYENSVLLSILEKITNTKKKERASYKLIQKSSDSPEFVIFICCLPKNKTLSSEAVNHLIIIIASDFRAQ